MKIIRETILHRPTSPNLSWNQSSDKDDDINQKDVEMNDANEAETLAPLEQ